MAKIYGFGDRKPPPESPVEQFIDDLVSQSRIYEAERVVRRGDFQKLQAVIRHVIGEMKNELLVNDRPKRQRLLPLLHALEIAEADSRKDVVANETKEEARRPVIRGHGFTMG